MSLGSYTRLGSLIFEWERFEPLDIRARYLWLSLYASSNAKNYLPGLWHASIYAMADAARMTADEVLSSLDSLIEHGLVEYDTKTRVGRMTVLPDAGEWPTNHFILKSWWGRFRRIPSCPVRDAHVTTLRWLMDTGAADSEKNLGGTPSPKHEELWAETFGTIAVPTNRRRGVRKLADSDTSTAVQPSLFADSSSSREAASFENHDAVYQSNDLMVRETLSRASREHREREEERERVFVSPSGSSQGSSLSPDPERTGVVIPFPVPTPVQAPTAPPSPQPTAGQGVRALVSSFSSRVNAARARVADVLGFASVRPCALMGGEQTLLDRLRESADPGGDLDHVLAVAEAEALASRELRWLSWSLAEPKAWRTRLSATLEEIRDKQPKRDYRGFAEGESVFSVAAETAAKLTAALEAGADPLSLGAARA